VSSCRLSSFALLSLTPSIGNRLVVNGQFPGPLIEANAGDTIVVNVKNSLDFPVRPLSFLHLRLLELTRPSQFPQIALHWHVRSSSLALSVSQLLLAISPLDVPLPPFLALTFHSHSLRVGYSAERYDLGGRAERCVAMPPVLNSFGS
jgi:hypothetical protein